MIIIIYYFENINIILDLAYIKYNRMNTSIQLLQNIKNLFKQYNKSIKAKKFSSFIFCNSFRLFYVFKLNLIEAN